MILTAEGFDWDEGNREKCQSHGLSIEEIESLFAGELVLFPDPFQHEERQRAIGRLPNGRAVFVVFTLRHKDGHHLVRPISARFMHNREIESYER